MSTIYGPIFTLLRLMVLWMRATVLVEEDSVFAGVSARVVAQEGEGG